jgi:hypothetical protein
MRVVCTNLVVALANRIPSLRVRARTTGGAAVTAIGVAVDGASALEAGEGRSIELDPGDHFIRIESSGYATDEARISIAEGERDRALEIVLSPVPALAEAARPAPPPGRAPIPLSAYALGGIALLSAGSFAFFAAEGKHTEDDLRGTCPSGPCDSSAMRREYLAADVSLATALLAGSAAAWLVFARGDDDRPAALWLRGAPVNGGGAMVAGGTF